MTTRERVCSRFAGCWCCIRVGGNLVLNECLRRPGSGSAEKAFPPKEKLHPNTPGGSEKSERRAPVLGHAGLRGAEAGSHRSGDDLKIMADAATWRGTWSGSSSLSSRMSSTASISPASPIEAEQQLRALRGDPRIALEGVNGRCIAIQVSAATGWHRRRPKP